ncbi:MAG: hypothetical protein NVSMB47_02190 [Polyangiales bacterium]
MLEPGSSLGSVAVTARRAVDDLWGRDASGTTVIVVTGPSALVATEEHALRALAGKVPVPRVLESATSPAFGPYLVLEAPPPGSDTLHALAPALSARDVVGVLTTVLDWAEAFERGGLSWSPRLDDFHLVVQPGARPVLGVRRLRGAKRLGKKARIDARHLIEEVGSALLTESGSLIPPPLLHLILRGRPRGDDERSIEAMRAALEHASEGLEPTSEQPAAAAVSDLGLLRDRHEDAAALACGDDWGVLVVCDGVSASHRSDLASQLVVSVVRDRLVEERADAEAVGVIHTAIRDAHRAICEACEGSLPAGTTVVAALVQRRRVAVGWVGDSRAYWLGDGSDTMLTRDHSWLNDVLASGLLSPEEALASPHAHALTRCLGPLEGGDPLLHAEPDLLEFDAPGPGHVILCSDGLWNYFPAAADLRAVLAPLGDGPTTAAMARALVNAALVQGGQDNVTVAVLAVK